ncbi:uncharacterized protein LACBIDRAFT_310008 [Laccaria bicolor S238N-H82]|uniref:Predicted protein n=1 Tax=Laccaria bicolor (strain S238N-H82 / ATCC MYA-4686) TaxID=486041 RepID=B0DTF9_LACBS|nr:uncharacterized protein LACBIDRAFT_310008 [Laccaria bicolor S238N-H82]EDR02057.1 predicted protein [Laccaria bicolor S238N-H82]|eukprot:XP_001887214.1 predicted protein [Laccaria bicolor S238N-H82]
MYGAWEMRKNISAFAFEKRRHRWAYLVKGKRMSEGLDPLVCIGKWKSAAGEDAEHLFVIDRQASHHVVPSIVRPANLMKVLTSDANALQDPTPVEAHVRCEVAQHKLRHEKMNTKRKLTKEQRHEKLEAKKADEEKKGI